MKITPSITRFFSGSKIITRLSARTTTRDNSPSITRTCFVEFEKRWWNTILVLLRMRWGSLTCAYLGRGILYIASPSHIPSLLSSSPTLFIYSLTSTPNLSYPLIYLLIYFSYLLLFFFFISFLSLYYIYLLHLYFHLHLRYFIPPKTSLTFFISISTFITSIFISNISNTFILDTLLFIFVFCILIFFFYIFISFSHF